MIKGNCSESHIGKRKNHKPEAIVFLCCILLAVCLIAAGIVAGQPESVMNKAIGICLECVGIG